MSDRLARGIARDLGGGYALTRQVAVTLTHAQILALRTTAVELVPAQGATRFVRSVAVDLIAHFPTPYSAVDDFAALIVGTSNLSHGVSAVIFNAGATTALSGFFQNNNGSTDHVTRMPTPDASYSDDYGSIYGPSGKPLTALLNLALQIRLTGASALTLGAAGNTLTVAVAYLVYDTAVGAYVP